MLHSKSFQGANYPIFFRANFLGYNSQLGYGNREFEDALVNPSYAVSPMKPMGHFLNLGTLVGIFPAKRGDKHIYFGNIIYAIVL